MQGPTAHLLAAALVAGLAGCQSISDSVTSPSRWVADSSAAIGDSSGASADSSNAFSRSISGSSSGDESSPEARFRDDVRVAASELAGRAASDADWSRELGRIAETHGISDWEAEPATFAAVEEGLRGAGLDDAQVEAQLARLFPRRADAALRR